MVALNLYHKGAIGEFFVVGYFIQLWPMATKKIQASAGTKGQLDI